MWNAVQPFSQVVTFLLSDLLCGLCVLCGEALFYLMASGFTGEATAPVTGNAGATNMNS
jgi:hypothetical protein